LACDGGDVKVIPSWLPSLVLFEDYEGDWHRYLDALYEFFKSDFINGRLVFEGRRVGLKRHPFSQYKEATFWHLISEGSIEDHRLPDMRRCERIRWPKPVMENSRDGVIKMWKNKRGKETRICLWLVAQEYLLVLADRKNYVLPWTAYMVDRPHTIKKLQKEFDEYWKKQRSENG
jgi:hypothetical protein